MKIKLYDNVVLIDGRKASIVEILGDHELYLADVKDGKEFDTIEILPEQISKILV